MLLNQETSWSATVVPLFERLPQRAALRVKFQTLIVHEFLLLLLYVLQELRKGVNNMQKIVDNAAKTLKFSRSKTTASIGIGEYQKFKFALPLETCRYLKPEVGVVTNPKDQVISSKEFSDSVSDRSADKLIGKHPDPKCKHPADKTFWTKKERLFRRQEVAHHGNNVRVVDHKRQYLQAIEQIGLLIFDEYNNEIKILNQSGSIYGPSDLEYQIDPQEDIAKYQRCDFYLSKKGCKAVFCDLNSLKAHAKTQHKESYCNMCQIFVGTEKQLETHRKKHKLEWKGMREACQACKVGFKNKQALSEHYLDPASPCHKQLDLCCGKSFTSKIDYAQHHRLEHCKKAFDSVSFTDVQASENIEQDAKELGAFLKEHCQSDQPMKTGQLDEQQHVVQREHQGYQNVSGLDHQASALDVMPDEAFFVSVSCALRTIVLEERFRELQQSYLDKHRLVTCLDNQARSSIAKHTGDAYKSYIEDQLAARTGQAVDIGRFLQISITNSSSLDNLLKSVLAQAYGISFWSEEGLKFQNWFIVRVEGQIRAAIGYRRICTNQNNFALIERLHVSHGYNSLLKVALWRLDFLLMNKMVVEIFTCMKPEQGCVMSQANQFFTPSWRDISVDQFRYFVLLPGMPLKHKLLPNYLRQASVTLELEATSAVSEKSSELRIRMEKLQTPEIYSLIQGQIFEKSLRDYTVSNSLKASVKTPHTVFRKIYHRTGFTREVMNDVCPYQPYWTQLDHYNALTESWPEGVCFVNPDYGLGSTFLKKAMIEFLFNRKNIVMILPSKTAKSKWATKYIDGLAEEVPVPAFAFVGYENPIPGNISFVYLLQPDLREFIHQQRAQKKSGTQAQDQSNQFLKVAREKRKRMRDEMILRCFEQDFTYDIIESLFAPISRASVAEIKGDGCEPVGRLSRLE